MEEVNELVKVLEELNSSPGQISEEVKERAKRLLSKVDPLTLSLAEQELINRGRNPEDLRGLCAIHLEMLEGATGKLRASLPPGHPIDTLMAEHDEILHFLDLLEGIVGRAGEGLDPEEVITLSHVAEHLVAAEKHHQREEDVIFPELEKRGITGPPRIMRLEHDELRPRKRRLYEIARGLLGSASTSFDERARKELEGLVGFIVAALRDHIFKENNILYPAALEAIGPGIVWDDIKRRCDEIGYCCFTPKA